MVETTQQKRLKASIMLGFIDKPPINSVITQAICTPSKIGGKPAWIATRNLPSTTCTKCS